MLTLETIEQEIRALPVEQRKQLVMAILDSLTMENQPEKLHDIREFRGAAAHLRDMDAQKYINQLRDEWDDNP